MNTIQRRIEQGIMVWVVWVIGAIVYFNGVLIITILSARYFVWPEILRTSWTFYIFGALTIPICLYLLFNLSIWLHRKLRG